ncbi:HEAT repeat domain-containing protein [Streptomyces erythrochromogenes]|uniref:HEAT repeat domain-containing protein n=1 Tax=Streptomyces erythrochromogenes TaxID=285574 RepID=UPI003685EF43
MGDHDTVRRRLSAALRADDPWTALYALHSPNTDLAGPLARAVEELYRSETDTTAFRPHLTWLLQSLGEPGDAVLLRLLAAPGLTGDGRRDLLRAAVARGLRLPAELLRTCAQDAPAPSGSETATGGPPAPELVNAMGLSGDLSFAPLLGALLDDPAAPRGRVALALGRLGARAWTAPIAGRLSEVSGLDHTAFTVALELMGDPAAVPHLLRWLAESAEERVYDVHHALVRLTGRDPLLPEQASGAAYAAAVRAAWADGRTERAPAAVRDLVVESGARARFSVDEGAGRIRFAFDPPSPGSSWPRWDRCLTFGGKPLYRVGSVCDTCELGLTLLDWPDDEAARIAARMRGRLADLDRLDSALLAEWSPVLGELETGHYRALLLDLPLERVAEPTRSWWYRRAAARAEEDGDDGNRPEYDRPEDYWPGVAHFQLTAPVPGGRVPFTYGALLPSQPPAALDPAAVARHAAAVAAGERPAAVVLGWIDDRYVDALHEERWLVGAILDGHHRLAAYEAAGVPARVLLLARVGGGGGADGGLEGLAEVAAAFGCRD